MHTLPTRACPLAAAAVALAGLCARADPAVAAAADPDAVLAVVGGQPITRGDVERSAAAELAGLEREYAQREYDLVKSHLDRLVEQRLYAAEAARRATSEEELLGTIDAAPVTDADVDLFYQQNEARIRGTKEQLGPQIREYLEQLSEQRATEEFVAALRARHVVDYRLEPLRVEVAATGPARGGPPEAPVTIVEFADFQCPYCAKIVPSIRQLLDGYGDRVRFVYRHYPLSIHADAQRAAEASLCAHEQGRFWEMHDSMFANIRALGADQLKATAAGLGLDAAQFGACLDSGRFAAAVAADTAAGNAAGVTGTPVLFVNGRSLSGAVPLADITAIVDDELRRRGLEPPRP
jgi:protein-disulfide isomerase